MIPESVSTAEIAEEASATEEYDEDDIETFHPDPHAGVDGGSALQAAIASAEAIIAPGSNASRAQRAAAEATLWEQWDLPLIDSEALGSAVAMSRVRSFLDTFAGGAPDAGDDAE